MNRFTSPQSSVISFYPPTIQPINRCMCNMLEQKCVFGQIDELVVTEDVCKSFDKPYASLTAHQFHLPVTCNYKLLCHVLKRGGYAPTVTPYRTGLKGIRVTRHWSTLSCNSTCKKVERSNHKICILSTSVLRAETVFLCRLFDGFFQYVFSSNPR